MDVATADLSDQHGEAPRVRGPLLGDFGGCRLLQGEARTLACFEDGILVADGPLGGTGWVGAGADRSGG